MKKEYTYDELMEMAIDRYGNDQNNWGQQRDGFIVGFKKAMELINKNDDIAIVNTITLDECWWCFKKFDKTTLLTVHSSELGGGSHPICPCCNEKFNLV